MRASSIRHLAVTDECSIVAAALFEKTVQIWSWKTGEQLGEFQTMLDFGGRRLALTPNGLMCIVGAWGQRGRGPRGLAAYSVPDGTPLWNRGEIRHIQHVRVSGSGREIYCGVEGSAAYIIDSGTGETIERVRGATKIVGSKYTSHQLIVQKGRPPRYSVRGKVKFEVPAMSFALLDAVFSPAALCLAEAKDRLHPRENCGGIRLCGLDTGKALWHLDIGSNRLAYNSADRRFYCVSAPASNPHESSLIRLGATLLECDQVALLGDCWEEAFSPSGTVLVTVHGDVFRTSTGDLLMHLDFPHRDYPDS